MVFETQDANYANILKGMLESNEINAVVLDQNDSAYGGTFGAAKIYVHASNVIKAKHLINEQQA